MELNVAKEVARLQGMTCGELRDEFATQTGETTNAKNRKWLIRRIIWRLQANAEGGLSESAIRKIRELAGGADLRVTTPASRQLSAEAAKRSKRVATGLTSNATLLLGTLLTRIYKGEQIRVRVTTQGFEYDGELIRSPTSARFVTKTKRMKVSMTQLCRWTCSGESKPSLKLTGNRAEPVFGTNTTHC